MVATQVLVASQQDDQPPVSMDTSTTLRTTTTAHNRAHSPGGGMQKELKKRLDADDDELTFDTSDMEAAMDPQSLLFKNQGLELWFRRHYFRETIHAVREAMIYATAVWTLFGINDILKNEDGKRKHFEVTIGIRAATMLIAVLFIIMSYRRSFRVAGQYILTSIVLLCGITQIVFGVLEKDTLDPTYSCVVILIASITSSFFRLRFGFSIFLNVVLTITYAVLTQVTDSHKNDNNEFATAIILLVVGMIIFSIHSYFREKQIRVSFLIGIKLKQEEKRSSRLLKRMLPIQVIDKLKRGAKFIFRKHTDMSVLFTNIHDFDGVAARLSAKQLVDLLNDVFSMFDTLTDRHKVYKVETIGDVYMVSSGVPVYRRDHAEAVCALALDMQKAMVDIREHVNMHDVHVRIGINSGPVIAGVIGRTYPRYRLMGDTINTASRMSTTKCSPDSVQVSPIVHKYTKHKFVYEDRGAMPVKGKGHMNIYILKAAKEDGANAKNSAKQWKTLMNAFRITRKSTKKLLPLREEQKDKDNVDKDPTTTQQEPRPKARVATRKQNMLVRCMTAPKMTLHRAAVMDMGGEYTSSVNSLQRSIDEDDDDDDDTDSKTNTNTNTKQTPPHQQLQQLQQQHNGKNDDKVQFISSKKKKKGFLNKIRSEADLGKVVPLETKVERHHTSSQMVFDFARHVSQYSRAHQGTSKGKLQAPPSPANLVASRSGSHTHSATMNMRGASLVEIPDKVLGQGDEFVALPSPDELMNKWTLRFSDRPALETDFLEHIFEKTFENNRKAIVGVMIGVLLIGVYESVRFTDETSKLTVGWILLGVGLCFGCGVILLSHTDFYRETVMQLFTSVTLFILSCAIIQNSVIFETHDKMFGVACTIIMLSLSSMAFGLRYLYVLSTCGFIFLFYVVSATAFHGSPPLVLFFLMSALFLYSHSAYSNEYYNRADYISLIRQEEERRRSSNLLDKMLPISIIEELQYQDCIAHTFSEASILFCDVVSFTKLAARIKAEELVTLLNIIFSTFDSLSEENGVYKVETIGDAYLACSGVVSDAADGDDYDSDGKPTKHTQRLAKFALAMQNATKGFQTPNKKPVVVRVGIHTGPVVAGVVGRKMPRYHLFGETYTIAESFEENGIPGRVVISKPTLECLDDRFVYTQVDPIDCSGVSYNMYVLHGLKGKMDESTLSVEPITQHLSLPAGQHPAAGNDERKQLEEEGETVIQITPKRTQQTNN